MAQELLDLIRKISMANPSWGSPRIVGELAKLGIQVAKATVEKCRVRPKRPPFPTWRAFLENHMKDLASVDVFVVPTVTFMVLFVLVVLSHARRRIVHFNVTDRVKSLGIEEVLTAPRSLWQNAYVERLIGTIRRECLDNVVVLHERHLRRLLGDFAEHYHRWRCHRSLAMDCPEPRPVQGRWRGRVVEVAEGGGLYRHYERRAA